MIYRTAGGGFCWGQDFERMDRLKDTEPRAEILPDDPVPVFTEDEELPMIGGRKRDARICVKMDTAGPVTILGLSPTVDTDGR